ncbi:RNA polymerase sigma factor [Actinacidiphila glaucinigra]|uniref:RNA polymerase sigma factor n=1 Tax=Actinacidiphila glaucinigra TaxID=235986 RepID=UPI00386BE9FE
MTAREGPRGHETVEEWFEAHADRVMGYLLHRTDRETAQDVLSETFLPAWRKQRSVPDDALPWLLANRVRSDVRRQALAERMAAVMDRAPQGVFEDRIGDRERVFRVLMSLSEADREVLLLTGWHDLSAQQAAKALGCTRAAYTLRLHRARKRFRAALERRPASFSPLDSEGHA